MRKKKVLWIILLIVGTLPFLIPLIGSLKAAIDGFSFLWAPAEFGFDGFTGFFAVYSYLFWPTYVIGLALIIGSIISLICSKEKTGTP